MSTPNFTDAALVAKLTDDCELEYLSVKEYARRTGRHVQTIYTAIRYKRFEYPVQHDLGTRTILIVVPRGSIQALKSA